ncbi:Signal transduction response regulator, receiver region domain protein, partial [Candidatus Magnetobacterium bavaricum]
MRKFKILIVEDEPAVFESMNRMLKRNGYEVLPPATTDIEAIESVKTNAPDLILMDIALKGEMDGIEAALHIQEISDVPVIYLSAHSDEQTFERARRSGSQGYFVKPVRYVELQTNIEMVLSKHKAEIDLKELNKQLIQNEQRYSSIVEGMGIGIAAIGKGMEILSLNQKMRQWSPHINISEKPLCYKSFNNPPKDRICGYCPVILSFKDGELHESITETPTAEGVKNFRIVASPLKDESGAIDTVIELVEDVTEQKDIQRRFMRQSEMNRSMAEVSRTLIQSDQISIQEISDMILYYAKILTESAYGYVGYIDPETGFLVAPTLTTDVWDKCNMPDKRFVFERLGGLVGWVLDNKKPLLTNEPEGDHRSVGTPLGHIPITRLLSVPSLLGNKLVGQLSVANSTHNYTEIDQDVLERLARYYSLAIERKRVDEELRRHNQRLEDEVKKRTIELVTSKQELKDKNIFSNLVIENVTDGLCVCHAVDQYPYVLFTVWNCRMIEITGYTMEEINKLGWYQSIYPDPQVQRRAVERMTCMRYGDNLVAERWEVTCKDGSKKLISISTSLIHADDGSVHVLALMQDITDSKKVEDDLRRAAYVIEQSPNIVVITDTKVNIEYVNRKFTEVTGYTISEVTGKNPRILKSGKTPTDAYTQLWNKLNDGKQWHGEFCNKLKDGR